MPPLRRSFALSNRLRLSWCLPALFIAAAAVGGCSGPGAERVYGYQAIAGETGSFDVTGRSSGMSRLQQDAIIAQAIAAHEMRRP
jgi:hypothetical protein